MIYPRETIRVGKCLAFIRQKGREKGHANKKRIYVKYKGEYWYCHRLSYHLNVKSIPRCPPNRKEKLVLHTCDNVWCIEPKHIYLGSQRQNVKDMYERIPSVRINQSKSHTGLKESKSTKLKKSKALKRFWRRFRQTEEASCL